MAVPSADNSVTGNKEVNIFQHYCPVPRSEVEQVSHVVFMNLIPYLLEHDIEKFGASVDMIQSRGFKKIEVSLQPPKLIKLMNRQRFFYEKRHLPLNFFRVNKLKYMFRDYHYIKNISFLTY